MIIEYVKCRADLNFKVNFGLNGIIGTVATWWDLVVFGKKVMVIDFFPKIYPRSITVRSREKKRKFITVLAES